MPGPSVMVRILGDASNLAKSASDVGSKFSKAAGSAHAAFSSMLGTLNQTGVLGPFGEALSKADEGLSQIAEHGKDVGNVMLGAGGALVAVGGLFSSLGSKEQAAHQQLSQAITNTGHSYKQYGDQIDAAIKHNEKFGQSSVETQGALQLLTQATGSPTKALALLSTATDLAAAKHEDLNTAATQLGKAYNGNAKLLKDYGIVLDKHTHLTKTGQTATQALAVVLRGQAAAASDTFNGHVKAMSTAIEDHISVLGEKYGPALQKTGAALAGLGAIMKTGQAVMGLFSAGQKTAAAATDVMSASEDAAAVSEGLALWPILLIVAAIALLVAAAYVIWKNWKTIWADIQKAVEVVWKWIQANWPLLLGILLGPIALAAALIYKNWAKIKADAKAVVDYIVSIWNNLVSFFTKLPGRLTAAASGAWNFISSEASTIYGQVVGVWNAMIGWVGGLPGAIFRGVTNLWKFIKDQASDIYSQVVGVWNAMIGWLGGLPRRIAGALAGMWSPIAGLFKAAINGVIGIWDSLHFTIGGWKVGAGPIHVTLPSVTVGMPHIPMLAQGGLMTSSGLVFAHAGEVITPAPLAAGGRGPVVRIDNAHFSTNMDVDAFMTRVAWIARKQAV
jgi:hypothetical protein